MPKANRTPGYFPAGGIDALDYTELGRGRSCPVGGSRSRLGRRERWLVVAGRSRRRLLQRLLLDAVQ